MLRTLLRLRCVSATFHQTKLLQRDSKECCRNINTYGGALRCVNAAAANQTNKNPFAEHQESTVEKPIPNDVDRERLLKVLKLEVDIAHQEGRRVPALEFFQDYHWEQVLKLGTKSARRKYYTYLWQIEMKKKSEARKKLERAEAVLLRKKQEHEENLENKHIIYGLAHTTMFLRIYDSTINHWQNNRLTRAMQFAPKVVLDCSYDKHMTQREAINAAKQLMLCFADNRAHDQPLDLHYCNVEPKSICTRALQRYIPTMYNPEFPMNVHQKCFTEMFPRERLVYLTPHCRNDMNAYNTDDVYIVGAMVDTVNSEPLSLAKAKKLGIRMARLPLDSYLQWGAGSGKSLTLDQMIKVLLDIHATGDWSKALVHVPRRKIVNEAKQVQEHKWTSKRGIDIEGIMNMNNDDVDNSKSHKMRSRIPDMQFKLETWGAKKQKN